jgi:hypothetical protein
MAAMKFEKTVITIGRKWNNPRIMVWVTDEEIGLGLSLDDFLIALAAEIGNPATLLTSAQMLRRIQASAKSVIETVKEHSAEVL